MLKILSWNFQLPVCCGLLHQLWCGLLHQLWCGLLHQLSVAEISDTFATV
jgi:hypothetical protein